MVELDFGKSDWVRSRKDPRGIEDSIISIPESGDLRPGDWVLEEGQIRDSHGSSKVTVPAEAQFSNASCEIMLHWIKERSEWVAIIHGAWNECGHTDEMFSGPFMLDEACLRKILRAYSVGEDKIALEKVRTASPEVLEKLAEQG